MASGVKTKFMTLDSKLVAALRRSILDEASKAFGFSDRGLARAILGGVFYVPARHFARLAAEIDQKAARHGLQSAAGELLSRYALSLRVHGQENIPPEGPLLLACNHPGAFDSVAMITTLSRKDLKIVVSGAQFLHSLPTLRKHFIFVPKDAQARVQTVRLMIRHLHSGGAVLVFASGVVDPDPAVLPGAWDAMGGWSPSLEIVLRRVPQARLLPAIISGVLSPAALRLPIIRIQKEAWKQRRLAEYFQVSGQMIFPRRFRFSPCISFGLPLSAAEMRQSDPAMGVMGTIIEQARLLLDRHMQVCVPGQQNETPPGR
jgi:hypothetical protein